MAFPEPQTRPVSIEQNSRSTWKSGRESASLYRLFLRNKGGATAIEFVALAIPFALLVFAILESCLSFAGQQVLANATDDIARQLRTGQIRAAEMNQTELERRLCDQMELLAPGDCRTNLEVDLRKFNTFAEAANVRLQLKDGDIDTTGFAVQPGASGTINMLRVFYRWPVITDLMRSSMSNLNGGKTLHFASTTWQNEPFDD
jgi:Flp pilus assembly protein TadG